MTAKTIKPKSVERAYKRLLKQIEANSERHRMLKEQFIAYKRDTEELVVSLQAQANRLNKTIGIQAVDITELQQKEANMYKENAVLRQDLQRAKEMIEQKNESLKFMQDDRNRLFDELTGCYLKLNAKQPSLFERIFGK